MNRKLLSLVGVFVAVCSFTIGGDQAEARCCGGRQQNRCGQQMSNCGSQQFGYSGCRQRRNCGYGYGRYNGNCCGQNGNYGYQQASNCGYQQSCNNGCQQASFQPNGGSNMANTCCAQATTACCTPQSGVSQTGFTNGQPSLVTPASGAITTQPTVNATPPIEPAKQDAPKPGA